LNSQPVTYLICAADKSLLSKLRQSLKSGWMWNIYGRDSQPAAVILFTRSKYNSCNMPTVSLWAFDENTFSGLLDT
jgi:hypothetical protein